MLPSCSYINTMIAVAGTCHDQVHLIMTRFRNRSCQDEYVRHSSQLMFVRRLYSSIISKATTRTWRETKTMVSIIRVVCASVFGLVCGGEEA